MVRKGPPIIYFWTAVTARKPRCNGERGVLLETTIQKGATFTFTQLCEYD